MLGTSEPEGYLPPDDGKSMLVSVAPLLRDADVTFVNLEGPLCDHGQSSKCGKKKGNTCYAFRSPTHYVHHLTDAGVDLASTANNHAGDFGDLCRRETEATLDAAKIVWSGARGSIGYTEVKGRKLALIAFHTSPAVNDVNDLKTAIALVNEAKGKADLVVVSFHGGAEGTKATRVVEGVEKFLGENRGDLRRFARGVIDAGADLVIGHGPHVLRGLELYQDRLIAYSLGNFATYGRFDLSGPLKVGAILEVTLGDEGKFVSGRVFSTVQQGKGVPAPDAENRAVKLMQQLSAQDFPKSAPRLADDGVLTPR